MEDKKMKFLQKLIISALIVIMSINMFAVVGFAQDTKEAPSTESTNIQTRVEETGWFYKVENGVLYKRLWSYTWGVWLTNWTRV